MPIARRRISVLLYLGPLIAALVYALASAGAARAAPLAEVFSKSKPDSTVTIDHVPLSQLLSAYVVAGSDGINRVRYADFKRDGHATLKTYIKSLEAVDVAKLSRAGQMSF